MKIGEPYVSTATYMRRSKSVDQSKVADLRVDLLTVTKHLNAELGQNFWCTDLVARTFDGSGCDILDLPSIATAAGVAVKINHNRDGNFAGESALAAAEYELTPRDRAFDGTGRPYTGLQLVSWGSQRYWPRGTRVQVTARWGWLEPPEQIVVATYELTRILRLEGARASNRFDDESGTIFFLSRDAQARGIVAGLLNDFWKPVFA